MTTIESADKQHITLVTLMSVGPNEGIDGIVDTVESIRHYCARDTKVVLCDNSGKGTARHVQLDHPDVDVVENEKPLGTFAGLYITLSRGIAHALQHYTFDTLLKMDVDSLIIGPCPEDDAMRIFRQQPRVGMLGQWPNGDDGRRHNYRPVGMMMLGQVLHPARWVSPPFASMKLLGLLVRAVANGYTVGDHVYGGGTFYRYELLKQMHQKGYLPAYAFRKMRLHDDHFCSLISRALGWEFGDLATDPLPVLETWRGLPCAPEELVRRRKKLVHSVRYWQDMKEDAIRGFFRQQRVNPVSAT
jgi:hypothetical protein